MRGTPQMSNAAGPPRNPSPPKGLGLGGEERWLACARKRVQDWGFATSGLVCGCPGALPRAIWYRGQG